MRSKGNHQLTEPLARGFRSWVAEAREDDFGKRKGDLSSSSFQPTSMDGQEDSTKLVPGICNARSDMVAVRCSWTKYRATLTHWRHVICLVPRLELTSNTPTQCRRHETAGLGD